MPTLKVVNKSDVMAFLMAGEHLVGAKQNRVPNASLMVPRQSRAAHLGQLRRGRSLALPLAQFHSGGSMSHGLLRKLLYRQPREGDHLRNNPSARQREVWSEVARKLGAMGSASPSQEFAQVYSNQGARLDEILVRLPRPEDCHGVAFALAGRIARVDLFDHLSTLAKLWPKLVRAYGLDVLEPSGERSPLGSTPRPKPKTRHSPSPA